MNEPLTDVSTTARLVARPALEAADLAQMHRLLERHFDGRVVRTIQAYLLLRKNIHC